MENRERLIQEDYIDTPHGPWKVLVICQCLNLATWMVAEKVVKELFERYPTPYMAGSVVLETDLASRNELLDIYRPLGFSTRRTNQFVMMSRQYASTESRFGDRYEDYQIQGFSGCGRYAEDAWNLFVLKKPLEPNDRHLMRYAMRVGLA